MTFELRTYGSQDLPELPFCANLPRLSDGFLICVKGQVWPNAKKFTIQLLGSAKDVALSIDFIYNGDEKLVVRSCLVNGQLKKRECDVFESTPKREDVFEVILLVTSSVFKCSINGFHAFDFPFYMRMESVTSYNIFGHCDIARISHQLPRPVPTARLSIACPEEKSSDQVQLPTFFPPQSAPPPRIGFLLNYSPLGRPTSCGDYVGESSYGTPANLIFPKGITPGKILTLYASTSPTSKWFKVSFKSSDDSPDCAFVVHVDLWKGEVARNDFVSGVCGCRETFVPYFPFRPGDPFCINFLCLPHLYKMAVNQTHILEFHGRGMSLEEVHCVQVEGDVFVSHFFESPT